MLKCIAFIALSNSEWTSNWRPFKHCSTASNLITLRILTALLPSSDTWKNKIKWILKPNPFLKSLLLIRSLKMLKRRLISSRLSMYSKSLDIFLLMNSELSSFGRKVSSLWPLQLRILKITETFPVMNRKSLLFTCSKFSKINHSRDNLKIKSLT